MTLVKEYKAYRRAYKELNHKIMEKYLKHDQLLKSAKLLGIAQKGTMVFKNEEETNVFMDFALQDVFITSGISFVFPPGLERYLLGKYEELCRKTEPERLSLERFVYFFRRSRKDGLRVIYQRT